MSRSEKQKRRVALTQSAGRLEGLERGLLERGFDVVRTPLTKTKPLVSGAVKRQAEALLNCPWLLYTSPSAVEAWNALELPFTQNSIGAVGQKTADTVKKLGGKVQLVGTPQTSAGLAATFLHHADAAGPVGLPRGNRALPTLQDELEQRGFEARPLVVYETLAQPWNAPEVDIVVLSSPSAVQALPSEVGKSAKLIALGPSTGAEIGLCGWCYEQAERPDAEAVLKLLEKWRD